MTLSFTDWGIIIKQTKFGEADKFVKILSAKHGLIEVVAKGSRRLSSRKSAHIDNLNLIKFQANQSNSGYYLNQAEVVNAYPLIKAKLKTIRTCYYLLEILNQVISLDQPDKQIFVSFKNYLEALEKDRDNPRQLTVNFQLYLIKHLGFPPPSDFSPQSLINYFEDLSSHSFTSTKIRV